jgi:hypothetical protein
LYLIRGAETFDLTSLRQADVLAGIPFPLLSRAEIHILGAMADVYDYAALPTISAKTRTHRGDAEWVTIQVPARFGLCAVLSNCCDLEPRGGGVQTPVVVLARLREIPPDIRRDPERFDSLKANKDPRTDDPGYIDYFYLESHEQLQGQDWMVHYNQVVTIPTTDITLLLQKKVIQLDDRTRMKFKIKLAFTLGRPNEDELDAGLEDPWQEAPPAAAQAQPQ